MDVGPGNVDEATIVGPRLYVGCVEVGDRLLLVDEEAGRGFALNPTASLLWRLLDGRSPLGDLIDDISETFAVPRAGVSASVTGLASTLGRLGLLTGVTRSLESIPIDIEYVDLDECGKPIPARIAHEVPPLGSRYLAAPPNA